MKGFLIPFKMITQNGYEMYRAQTLYTKEPETIAWIQFLFKDGEVFFDVGACIGLYSLFAARCYPDLIIHAFEPAENNITRLCENVNLNGFDKITPHKVALTNHDGTEKMFVTTDTAGASGHTLYSPIPEHTNMTVREFDVPVKRLDTLVKEGLPVPTHVKIDVDGADFTVIEGMTGILNDWRLKSIFVECRGEEFQKVKTLLADYGFTHRTPFTKYAMQVKGFIFLAGHNHYMVVDKTPNIVFLRRDTLSKAILNDPIFD